MAGINSEVLATLLKESETIHLEFELSLESLKKAKTEVAKKKWALKQQERQAIRMGLKGKNQKERDAELADITLQAQEDLQDAEYEVYALESHHAAVELKQKFFAQKLRIYELGLGSETNHLAMVKLEKES